MNKNSNSIHYLPKIGFWQIFVTLLVEHVSLMFSLSEPSIYGFLHLKHDGATVATSYTNTTDPTYCFHDELKHNSRTGSVLIWVMWQNCKKMYSKLKGTSNYWVYNSHWILVSVATTVDPYAPAPKNEVWNWVSLPNLRLQLKKATLNPSET